MDKESIAVRPNRDISDQRFGKLVAVSPVEKTPSGTKWKCACDCGAEAVVCYSDLARGRQKSCGCSQHEIHRKPFGQAAANRVLSQYKRNASKRQLTFSISDEDFLKLTKQSCFYCGKKPSSIYSEHNMFGDYVYNGVDRIDNTEGYDKPNVVSCCSVCNMMKKSMLQDEFINQCKKVAKRHA